LAVPSSISAVMTSGKDEGRGAVMARIKSSGSLSAVITTTATMSQRLNCKMVGVAQVAISY
jgi:hypothetical protein